MDYYCIPLALLFAWTLFQGLNLLVALTSNRSKKLPPGPFPLSIIGNLHLLGIQPHRSLAKLADSHGPIMHLKLGQITTVVISSSDMAKQMLQKQDLAFSSRSIPDTVQVDNFHMFSVVWLPASWPQWRTLRKILNSHIFSVNKLDATQHLRYKKMEELVVYCKRSSQMGEAVDIGGAIFRTMLNLLSNTLISKDLADPYENSGKEFKDLVEGLMIDMGKPNWVDYFPVLKLLDPQGLRRYNSHFGKLLKFFNGLINERMELRKMNGQKSSDVLDTLLTATEDNPQDIDRKHIATILLSIMKETFWLHHPAPLLVPRKVEQDVEVCGYTIPKGSKVLINVWAIGRDSTLWEDPLMFNPHRFKDSKLDVRGQDF